MTKDEIVQSIVDGLVPQSTKDTIASGVDQAIELGKSQGGGNGLFTQEQADQMVSDAVAKALVDAQTKEDADIQAVKDQAQADFSVVQKALDDMTAKDLSDIAAGAGIVADAQTKFAAAKASMDAVLALVLPSQG